MDKIKALAELTGDMQGVVRKLLAANEHFALHMDTKENDFINVLADFLGIDYASAVKVWQKFGPPPVRMWDGEVVD
jgi:hypothetical protein